jgi:hypothetical protein
MLRVLAYIAILAATEFTVSICMRAKERRCPLMIRSYRMRLIRVSGTVEAHLWMHTLVCNVNVCMNSLHIWSVVKVRHVMPIPCPSYRSLSRSRFSVHDYERAGRTYVEKVQ